MGRVLKLEAATQEQYLDCVQQTCVTCGRRMWQDYNNTRQVRTLKGAVKLHLKIRRCPNPECVRYHKPYRPEAEGRWALPEQEFGLDVIALVGALRYQEHRSIAEIHQQLVRQNLCISERSVSNLLSRYDELLCLRLTDSERLHTVLKSQAYLILAIDGLQPTVGHEALWVMRECISGEILLARTLLSATEKDLVPLLAEIVSTLPFQIRGVVSDGQQSIANAVKTALPEAAHGLCHFHYLKEASKHIYEADRHAKKELKKKVRGIRPIECAVSTSPDEGSEVIQGYCQAVRAALTDEGRPPLEAPGIRLQERLTLIHQSLDRVEKKGDWTKNYRN